MTARGGPTVLRRSDLAPPSSVGGTAGVRPGTLLWGLAPLASDSRWSCGGPFPVGSGGAEPVCASICHVLRGSLPACGDRDRQRTVRGGSVGMKIGWRLRMAAAQREVWTGAQLRWLLAERAVLDLSSASVSAFVDQGTQSDQAVQPGRVVDGVGVHAQRPVRGGHHTAGAPRGARSGSGRGDESRWRARPVDASTVNRGC